MPLLDVNGIRLFHRLDGPEHAPVLALSNSLGTDHAMWEPQMAAFSKRFRVLRYDTRGHGRSGVPAQPATLEQLGRDFLGLLDGLGLQRVHFCGLSLGGMTGMWLGSTAPARIERLVLCNTSAQMGPPEPWNARIEAVRTSGMAAVTEAVIGRWFTSGFRARSPEAVERVRRMLLETPKEGYAACCAAIRDMDQREAIASIRSPTLVIAGRQDPATPPDHARFIAARIAGAKLVELDAAHLSNVEAAEKFTQAVLGFLEGRAEGEAG
jgi:3-oxoadipate enol-lactonase